MYFYKLSTGVIINFAFVMAIRLTDTKTPNWELLLSGGTRYTLSVDDKDKIENWFIERQMKVNPT